MTTLLLASSISIGVGGAVGPATDGEMDDGMGTRAAEPGTMPPVQSLAGAREIPKNHDRGTSLDIDYRCGPSRGHGLMLTPSPVGSCTFLTILHQEEETLRLVTLVSTDGAYTGLVALSVAQVHMGLRISTEDRALISWEVEISPFNVFEKTRVEWFVDYDVTMEAEILEGGGQIKGIRVGAGQGFFSSGDWFDVNGRIWSSEQRSTLDARFTFDFGNGFRLDVNYLPSLAFASGHAGGNPFEIENLPTSFQIGLTEQTDGSGFFRVEHDSSLVSGRWETRTGWITFENLARSVSMTWHDQGSVWEECMSGFREAGDRVEISVQDSADVTGMSLRFDLDWSGKHLVGEIDRLRRAEVVVDLEEQAIDAELGFVDGRGEIDLSLTGLHKEWKVGECLWSAERPMEIEFTGLDIEVLEFSRDPDRSVETRLAAALPMPSGFQPLPWVFAHMELDLWWSLELDAGVLRGTSYCVHEENYKLVLPHRSDTCTTRVGGCADGASYLSVEVCALKG